MIIYIYDEVSVCVSRKMITSSCESSVTTHNNPVQLQVSFHVFSQFQIGFHGSMLVFIGFQGLRLVFQGFKVPGWFFEVPGGF